MRAGLGSLTRGLGGLRSVSPRVVAAGSNEATLAAWNTGSIGAWLEIPGTNLSSVAPDPVPAGATGPQSKVTAWAGWALNTQTDELVAVCQGGHTDYAGNEANRIDLGQAAPAWTQQLAPTASGSVTDTDYYSDGRPASVHSYYMVEMDETANRVILFGGSRWNSGAIKNVVDGYDVAASAYLASGTYPSMPSGTSGLNGQEVKACCRDPRNGDVYIFAQFNVGKWTRSSNTFSMPVSGQTAPFAQYTSSAFDSTRNRIFLLGNGVCFTYDPDSNTVTTRTLSGESLTANSMMGMVYEPSLDLFIVSTGAANGALYSVHPTTFVASVYSTSGGTGMPAESKPLKRFLYVPSQQGIIWAPSYTGNLWFLRTH